MTMLFEQLWNGQIAPCKNCGRNDPEVQNLAALMERNKSALEHALGERQKELLKAYGACCDEYTYLITIHAFHQGFSLAGKLLAQVLAEDI